MINDRVGDFITRLKNAAAIGRREVSLPYSAHLAAVAKKLKELGFLAEVRSQGEVKKTLTVALSYDERGVARLRGARRVSTPGRRVYTSHRRAHKVAGGTGARILSTPEGILSDAEARKSRIGGEALFEIW